MHINNKYWGFSSTWFVLISPILITWSIRNMTFKKSSFKSEKSTKNRDYKFFFRRAFLHRGAASYQHCQQEGPNGCSNSSGRRVSCNDNCRAGRGVHREVFVVDVCNYVLSTCVGLLARRLDLILGELEAKVPLVSELEGEGERDSAHAGPVPGWARVGVCTNRMQNISGYSFCKILSPVVILLVCLYVWLRTIWPEATCTYTVHQVKFLRCSSSRAPSRWPQLHPDRRPSEKSKNLCSICYNDVIYPSKWYCSPQTCHYPWWLCGCSSL